jgi:exodeoxyribonuclease VII small subunit
MADAPKFEEGLAALEKLVDELEAGELGLDEALKRFEKGVKLSGQLQVALADAGRKVEQLVKGSAGEAVLEAFEDDEAGAAPAKKPRGKKAGQDTLF